LPKFANFSLACSYRFIQRDGVAVDRPEVRHRLTQALGCKANVIST